MLNKQMKKTVSKWVKLYIQNTSIHGFRYALETPYAALKSFWVVSISFAFCACSLLIFSNLKNAQNNPTITTVEEILLNDVSAPAISILVPPAQDEIYIRWRMANSIRACNASVDILKSKKVRKFLAVTKALNALVRKGYYPRTSELKAYGKKLKSMPIARFYERFCDKLRSISSSAKKSFIAKLNAKIDTHMLVTDMEAMIGQMIPNITSNATRIACDLAKGKFSLLTMRDWMVVNSPIAFKENQRMTCRNR